VTKYQIEIYKQELYAQLEDMYPCHEALEKALDENEELRVKLVKAEALAVSAELLIMHTDFYGATLTHWAGELSKSLKEYRGEETK